MDLKRGRQRDCQIEPVYPGQETVVMSFRDPDMVAHWATTRCPVECPHLMSVCGEFDKL